MPTTVHQLIEGTEVTTGASPSVTLKYFVDGAASENAALDAVLSTCPATYNGMPRQSRSAEPISDTKYLVTARYSPQESNDPGSSGQAPPESSYEFNTSGGSETMFVSLSTKQRVALPGRPPAPCGRSARRRRSSGGRRSAASPSGNAPRGASRLAARYGTRTPGAPSPPCPPASPPWSCSVSRPVARVTRRIWTRPPPRG